jgi:hypothetical protein
LALYTIGHYALLSNSRGRMVRPCILLQHHLRWTGEIIDRALREGGT